MRNTGQPAAVVLVAALAAVAPGSAYAARLSGQVIGPPYAAKKGMSVLVLLNPKSSRRAKLKSPIGELRVISRTMKVAGGSPTATERLRVNDRFRTRAKVRRGARRTPYWRITSRKLKVTQRATTLSPAELEELVKGLRADLSKLSTTVEDLARYTAAEFLAVRADLASLRADVNALRSEFTSLSAQIAAMNAQLDALAGDVADLEAQLQSLAAELAALDAAVTSLAADLAALQSELADLSADLAALTATVGGLSGQLGNLGNLGSTVEQLLSGVGPGDLAGTLADVATLQSSVATLQGEVTGLQADVDILCGPTSPLDALC